MYIFQVGAKCGGGVSNQRQLTDSLLNLFTPDADSPSDLLSPTFHFPTVPISSNNPLHYHLKPPQDLRAGSSPHKESTTSYNKKKQQFACPHSNHSTGTGCCWSAGVNCASGNSVGGNTQSVDREEGGCSQHTLVTGDVLNLEEASAQWFICTPSSGLIRSGAQCVSEGTGVSSQPTYIATELFDLEKTPAEWVLCPSASCSSFSGIVRGETQQCVSENNKDISHYPYVTRELIDLEETAAVWQLVPATSCAPSSSENIKGSGQGVSGPIRNKSQQSCSSRQVLDFAEEANKWVVIPTIQCSFSPWLTNNPIRQGEAQARMVSPPSGQPSVTITRSNTNTTTTTASNNNNNKSKNNNKNTNNNSNIHKNKNQSAKRPVEPDGGGKDPNITVRKYNVSVCEKDAGAPEQQDGMFLHPQQSGAGRPVDAKEVEKLLQEALWKNSQPHQKKRDEGGAESGGSSGGCDTGYSSRCSTPPSLHGDNPTHTDSDGKQGTKRHLEVPSRTCSATGTAATAATTTTTTTITTIPTIPITTTTNSSRDSRIHNLTQRNKTKQEQTRVLSDRAGTFNEEEIQQQEHQAQQQQQQQQQQHGGIDTSNKWKCEVADTPSQLLTGSEWDGLSQQVWDMFKRHQQTNKTFDKKIRLKEKIYKIIRQNVMPKCRLYVVGSSLSGFGADCSDVDMCLMLTPYDMDQRTEAINILKFLQCELNNCGFFRKIELIRAKVPILKFRDAHSQVDVDLNCNNTVGIRNTHLLNSYSQLDWRVRPLTLVVKLWAQHHNINNAKDMTISSYSLVLMVIHYLQHGAEPPVLPCLQKAFPDKFRAHDHINSIPITEKMPTFTSNNRDSLGKLFHGLLDYFANKFTFIEETISVRTGGTVPTDQCRNVFNSKNNAHMWKYLCIEEPFDLTNTARSVYDEAVFEHVKKVFVDSFKHIDEKKDLSVILSEA
ncbi:hypothetical protein Pcinc_017319 [Petrolisthes cinctipes]|uniref:PAP-associated domain-containing protein n=1 Tax=Petrolisthes cinctipes TaxID=88211 RepID=A0AAE1FPE2_PETCI|nr:hypothetical protein Pcinc_017319 [Petrolisthes cinctipes]